MDEEARQDHLFGSAPDRRSSDERFACLASVTDQHGRLRICKTGFDSLVRYFGEVGGQRPEVSKKTCNKFLISDFRSLTSFIACECGGSHATLRRSKARFDSWTGYLRMTLEPDGEATGCNPVEVGSIPTGVSYLQLQARFDIAGPAAHDIPRQRLVSCVPNMGSSESEVRSTKGLLRG